jgi:capsid portal protein
MYFQSALNGSIINYKANATIGGGYEITSNDTTAVQKVKEYTFIKKNKFNKLMRQLTKDLIMHGRVCIIIDPTMKDISIKRVGPEKVRVNISKTLYTISDDWARSIGMYEIKPYYVGATEKTLFVYEIDGDAGQDIYPIPQYCSALNDAFLDGEMSYLQKSNIINSIFPSFMIKLAKKFGSQDEINQFKDTINKAKGAPNAGRIMTFVANSPDQLPTIETIPTNNNDKIFDSTLQRVDANICRAHSIDPLLMGIRISGSLGNGNELQQSYVIFEKNVVMPLREMMEEVADELLFIAGINSTIKINNYQIIGEEIVDKTNPIK